MTGFLAILGGFLQWLSFPIILSCGAFAALTLWRIGVEEHKRMGAVLRRSDQCGEEWNHD